MRSRRRRSKDRLPRLLQDAKTRGIAGKEVTPFLLARIRDLTQGESQRANVALVLNNARLAGKIACALSTSIKRYI